MTATTPALTNKTPQPNPFTSRRALTIYGGLFIFFGVYVLAFMIPDFLTSMGGPTSMPLAEAAAIAGDSNAYVHITDGTWDCGTVTFIRARSSTNNARIETRFTEAFLVDDASNALFVTHSGEQGCEALQSVEPTGYLTLMSDGTREELTNEARLARFFDRAVFMEMCGYCGTTNAVYGIIGGSVSLIGGLALVVVARRKRETPPAA